MEKAYPVLWDSDRRDYRGIRIPLWRVWYPLPRPHLGTPCRDGAAAQKKADIWNSKYCGGAMEEK